MARGGRRVVRDLPADAVHAHDRNTLELAASEARRRGVPYVYDSHELWSGRRLPGRPSPLADERATARETALARGAAAVLTVSEGIAEVLSGRGLPDVRVVRNTFEMAGAPDDGPLPSHLHALVYAGRIGAGRDLETLVRVPVLAARPAGAAGRPGRPVVPAPVAARRGRRGRSPPARSTRWTRSTAVAAPRP